MSTGKGLRGWTSGSARITHLADTLKNAYGVFEKANMEDGYNELDVCVMPHALYRAQAAGLAERAFLRGTLKSRE